jgi:ketosteroid isomerase-like protein
MPEQENVQIVKTAYDAFKSGDIPSLLNLLAENVEWIQPGPPETIATAGERHGPEQVAQYFALVNETFNVEQFEPQEFIAQGEKVVVLGHYRRRVKATGKLDESEWVHVFTVRGGKIEKHRAYADTAATLAAISGSLQETSADK